MQGRTKNIPRKEKSVWSVFAFFCEACLPDLFAQQITFPIPLLCTTRENRHGVAYLQFDQFQQFHRAAKYRISLLHRPVPNLGLFPGESYRWKIFLGEQIFPGEEIFPGEKLFPREKIFPGDKIFLGKKIFPGDKIFPGEKTFPGEKIFPGDKIIPREKIFPGEKIFPWEFFSGESYCKKYFGTQSRSSEEQWGQNMEKCKCAVKAKCQYNCRLTCGTCCSRCCCCCCCCTLPPPAGGPSWSRCACPPPRRAPRREFQNVNLVGILIRSVDRLGRVGCRGRAQ